MKQHRDAAQAVRVGLLAVAAAEATRGGFSGEAKGVQGGLGVQRACACIGDDSISPQMRTLCMKGVPDYENQPTDICGDNCSCIASTTRTHHSVLRRWHVLVVNVR